MSRFPQFCYEGSHRHQCNITADANDHGITPDKDGNISADPDDRGITPDKDGSQSWKKYGEKNHDICRSLKMWENLIIFLVPKKSLIIQSCWNCLSSGNNENNTVHYITFIHQLYLEWYHQMGDTLALQILCEWYMLLSLQQLFPNIYTYSL